MKKVIIGFAALWILAAVALLGPFCHSAHAEISCEVHTLPENDVIDTDVGDLPSHRDPNTGPKQWVPGAVRVMISALHDQQYHEGEQWYKDTSHEPPVSQKYDYQTEDGKVLITVEIWVPEDDCNPNGGAKPLARHNEIENTPVWILTIDPADKSVYAPNPAVDDNRDDANLKRGNLTVAPGFAAEPNPIVKNGKTIGFGIKPKYDYTLSGWRVYTVKAVLEITSHCGGDNYQILASFSQKLDNNLLDANQNPKTVRIHHHDSYVWDCQPSGTMCAWKRCYLEMDKMFRNGRSLKFDMDNGNLTQIILRKKDAADPVAEIAAGDRIMVFDTDNDDAHPGEIAEIISVTQGDDYTAINIDKNLEAGNQNQGLQKAYMVNKLASIGVLVNCDANGQFNEGQTYFLANLELLKKAYDPAFIELNALPDGVGPIPFEYKVGYTGQPFSFSLHLLALQMTSQPWFKNKDLRIDDDITDPPARTGNAVATGKENYFHIVAASTSAQPDSASPGISNYKANYVFLFVWTMEAIAEAEQKSAETFIGEVLCHEIGHQFHNMNNPDTATCDQPSAINKDKFCIMNDSEEEGNDPFDGEVSFCLQHMLTGRGQPQHFQKSLRDMEDRR